MAAFEGAVMIGDGEEGDDEVVGEVGVEYGGEMHGVSDDGDTRARCTCRDLEGA